MVADPTRDIERTRRPRILSGTPLSCRKFSRAGRHSGWPCLLPTHR